jgi:hypothetical protein
LQCNYEYKPRLQTQAYLRLLNGQLTFSAGLSYGL